MALDIALSLALAATGCQSYGTSEQVGTLPITESSGIGVSLANEGIIWTHNDSGAGAQLIALWEDGSIAATLRVNGASAIDWEAMELGPCPDLACSCIFVGDIGDNTETRLEGTVYILPEPAIPPGALGLILETELLRAQPFTYPDGPHNAETLFVDPLTGSPYVVTKDIYARVDVMRFPQPLPPSGQSTNLLRVSRLNVAHSGPLGRLTTGGAVSPGGDKVIIRTYKDAWEWEVPEAGLDYAFQSDPTRVDLPRRMQGEAIGYGADGASLWVTTEGDDAPLDFIPCRSGEVGAAPLPALGQLCSVSFE